MSNDNNSSNSEPTLQLVTCSRDKNRQAPMSMKPGQLERVLAGGIECVVCKTACKPSTVRLKVPERGVTVPAWDDDTGEWCDVFHSVMYLPKPIR
jgi:hypothetical protein